MKTTFNKIRKWARDRGIYKEGDVKSQYVKLGEEFGELGAAILKGDRYEIEDAIGDMVIVLTNLTELHNLNCDNCDGDKKYYKAGNRGSIILTKCEHCKDVNIDSLIKRALKVIENRKGKMDNGTFKKIM